MGTACRTESLRELKGENDSVVEVTSHPSERDLPSSLIYLAARVVARAALRLEGDGEAWGTRTSPHFSANRTAGPEVSTGHQVAAGLSVTALARMRQTSTS